MNNKLQPALVGGVLLGVLSVIPYVANACCLWAVLGGGVASYLYIKRSPVPAHSGDGAILGVVAGTIGALIYLVVVLLSYFGNRDQYEAQLAQLTGQLAQSGVSFSTTAFLSVIAILAAVLMIVAAIIGGLGGVAIFEKRKAGMDGSPPMPPPPPNFGGQPISPPPPPDFSNPPGGGS